MVAFSILSCKRNSVSTKDPGIPYKQIYVLEKDELFGGFLTVDNYHLTMVFNGESTPVTTDIESPFPSHLKIESGLSPSFGRDAIIPTDYPAYFNLPSLTKYSILNEPTLEKDSSHIWSHINIPPDSGVVVPYSNYYGMGKELFVQSLGVNQFQSLQVSTLFDVQKTESEPQQFDITIHEILENISNDSLFNISLILHVPRTLYFKSEKQLTLYNTVSDSVYTSANSCYISYLGRLDGYRHATVESPEITIYKKELPPGDRFDLYYEMKITCMQEKFEIYPLYLVYYVTKGDRIWPASNILIDSELYNGHVDYLYKCNLAIPTYIVLAIDHGNYEVVDPDSIVPTFYDPF